ncbi:hypothetical protein AAAC51_16250 [Priestia megaterium]
MIQGLAVYYIAMTYKNLLHQLFSYTIYILSATYILVTPIEQVLSLPTLNWLVVLASILVFIWISIQKQKKMSMIRSKLEEVLFFYSFFNFCYGSDGRWNH